MHLLVAFGLVGFIDFSSVGLMKVSQTDDKLHSNRYNTRQRQMLKRTRIYQIVATIICMVVATGAAYKL